jgi:hypothetical protein
VKSNILLTLALLLINSVSADPTTQASANSATTTGIIDTHLHAYACQPDGLDKVAKWMCQNGVVVAITHPLPASLPTNDQQRKTMLANYNKHQGAIKRFCIFGPDEVKTVKEAVEKMLKEKKDGAIGFGEHYGKGLMFDDPSNMRLYTACSMVGFPVMFHMDNSQNKDEPGLPHLEAALKAHPKCLFIAHGPFWWKQLGTGDCDRLLENYPNLYADLSAGSGARALGKDKKYTRKFMISHSQKLLFATDFGWWSFKKNTKPAPQFALMENLDLPEKIKHLIYRGNAERLFGFKTAPAPKK